MVDERLVRVTREIKAAPDDVFQAVTHPLDLSYWFSHYAWTEPKTGGDFYVRWRNGWWARGEYLLVERPRRVELTWLGKDEPGQTRLAFEIKALDQVTSVSVIHSGYGVDAIWDKAVAEAEGSWPLAMENLESVLTTGVDLRQASRPVLGVVPDDLTPDRAARESIAADSGIYLTDVLAKGGAADAGLQTGDVIVSIGGLAVPDSDSLITTLASHRAGERVQVRYVRGHERGVAAVELKPRALPDISFNPVEVTRRVRQLMAPTIEELREITSELSDEEASEQTSPDAWSIKEALAHLSISERHRQVWFADVIVGNTMGQMRGNISAAPELLATTLASACSVDALLARWEQDLNETLKLFESLRPELIANRARYRAMANSLLGDIHIREHTRQIQTTVEALAS